MMVDLSTMSLALLNNFVILGNIVASIVAKDSV